MFEGIKKNFGFGCMRLPRIDEEVDLEEFARMVDAFMDAGFNYFDTAKGYMKQQSEPALRECLTKRYPRDSYILTDKLSNGFFKTEEEIRPLFAGQLATCGVEYFDFYLFHAMNADHYEKYTRCRAFEIVRELKAEGKIRHIGMSFHDKPQVLERILKEHPEIEVVQLQFNYADYDDPAVESYGCYKVCETYHRPVIVMEPVKGGRLVNLPEEARPVLDALGKYSYAGYALRYCASFPNVFMVLSGMGSMEMMEDNVRTMKDFTPFTEEEYRAVEQVRDILRRQDAIPCTACRYCTDGCPANISIPDLLACYNAKRQDNDDGSFETYRALTANGGRASDCIRCGQCDEACPQHLNVKGYMKKVAKVFDR